MAVYVDALTDARSRDAQAARVGARNGHQWCHLMADTDDELHAFAHQLKLRRSWCHGDHYDLTPGRRELAVRLGALEVTSRDLVALRQRKRTA